VRMDRQVVGVEEVLAVEGDAAEHAVSAVLTAPTNTAYATLVMNWPGRGTSGTRWMPIFRKRASRWKGSWRMCAPRTTAPAWW